MKTLISNPRIFEPSRFETQKTRFFRPTRGNWRSKVINLKGDKIIGNFRNGEIVDLTDRGYTMLDLENAIIGAGRNSLLEISEYEAAFLI